LDSSSNNSIMGNICQSNDLDGICLDHSSNNTITGNTFQGNGRHGIYFNYSSSNTICTNTIVGNSQNSNNTYDGINVGYIESDYNNIQGNTVRRGNGTNKQRSGIWINLATGNLVINNDLYWAGTTSDNSDTGSGTIIHNNRTRDGWVP